MNILVAVPTFENIYPDTFKSIYDLDDAGNDVAFEYVRGYDCATARNRIAQMSMDGNYDYVLMVDNDVVLPKDTLKIMLDDPKDVCLGYYAHRNNKNEATCRTSVCKLGWYNYPTESQYTVDDMADLRKKGVHKEQIHGGGMGCAFIKVEVFRKLAYPWYDWVNYDDDNRGMLSEDLFFCERCRKAHIDIYTDTRAGCGHIFRQVQNVIREG